MDGYILDIRNKYGHLTPKKPQYLPPKHRPINYGSRQQIVQPIDTSPRLDDKFIKIFQGIFGVLLYMCISINNKLLVALSALVSQQALATEETEDAIEKILNYVATYPTDGIIFRKSDMILAAHADAVFLH